MLGGGNSAGQAAAHLAKGGAHVTVLVRGASLAATMSDYLVREIDASANITVRFGTEVVGAGTDGQLDHLELRDRNEGTTTARARRTRSSSSSGRARTPTGSGARSPSTTTGSSSPAATSSKRIPAAWPLERCAVLARDQHAERVRGRRHPPRLGETCSRPPSARAPRPRCSCASNCLALDRWIRPGQ